MTRNDKKTAAKAIIIYSVLLMIVSVVYPQSLIWVLLIVIVSAGIITLKIRREEDKINKEIDYEIEYDGNGY